ncbi:MAG: hypothetical protein K0R60_1689 [Microbacterium sp.]|nr:hypothetical protein [Microbacterium sp.]
MMPTGPSYVLRSSSSAVRRDSFSLPANTEIGRVCGTSDIIEPSETIPVMSSRNAMSTSSFAKACHARAGSAPVSNQSCVPRIGRSGRSMIVSGHFRVRPPSASITTCGRVY